MRFFAAVSAATAVFGVTALAAETVQLKDFTVRVTGNDPAAASFKVQPDNVSCSATSVEELSADTAVVCGESAYRFELKNGSNGFWALTVHKQTAPGAGVSGTKEVQPTSCHAGGNGPDDNVCDLADTDITLN
ncbi:putative hypersensitive response-inducing protein elicitor protein [Lasiodiplodia theobromae]|uniref:Effector protein PevD1 n=1 Tax=Lasiodiplodia theobromae TaxID=45133 RepID=A0A5N5DLP3_9PEZI|nr:Protein elicitor [Lasiodiplodia theobromae]KAB2578667.1 Effector protein PevD1 [Lasiodiplodia theobromae]KAF4535269.1 Protein elicitor [Lasiodiplodia theobromae]KAF9638545.1 putative hypersensitive response-inducing protein elicitor protein [Lasiodiplodia theobromae]